MRVRIKDVAARAGVVPSTVSLVLNDHPKARTFSEEARQRVRDAADELGYRPLAAARALVTNRTYNIGFIIPEYAEQKWANPFYSGFLNGVDEACYRLDYSLFVHCCNLSNAVDFVFPRGVKERNVDGLIISNAVSADVLKRFESLDVPCVRVGISGGAQDSVVPEFSPGLLKGYMLALEYLSRLGHTQVAIMDSGSAHTKTFLDQIEQQLQKSGLGKVLSLSRHLTNDGRCGAAAAPEFAAAYFAMDSGQRPSAVITNPQTCLGILKEIEKYGLRCPEDLSVISNFEFDVFEYLSPAITSLRYDSAAIGAYAAEKLIAAVKADDHGLLTSKMDFPVTLEVRDSCHDRK